jgi:hypothetical protein
MVKPSVAGFLKVCDIIENVSCAVSLKEVGYCSLCCVNGEAICSRILEDVRHHQKY